MTRMGRPPKPTAVKRLDGNPGRRRLNDHEPQPDGGAPQKPLFVTADIYASELWDQLAPQLHNMGVLTVVDGIAFAAFCFAYARWRRAEEDLGRLSDQDPATHGVLIQTRNGNAVQNPLVGVANVSRRDMLRAASELGLTPASRSLLQIQPDFEDEISRKYNL